MSEPPSPNAELMRALRRLVRGLSALFWGLPVTLLVTVQGASSEWLRSLGVFPPVVATGLLLYGLVEMGHFHKQERPWREALELARLFALVNVGLSPFVFLWSEMPREPFFTQAVGLLALSCVLFLAALNRVLQRLAAMLPDETLREETRMFASLNLWLMFAVIGLVAVYLATTRMFDTSPGGTPNLFVILLNLLAEREAQRFLLLFLILLPLSITMTMIWKIKETVLAGVFGGQSP
jgi:hypothetical protein